MKNNIKKDQGCDQATRDNLQEEDQKGKAGNGRGTDRKKTKGKERETGGGGQDGRRVGERVEFYYMTDLGSLGTPLMLGGALVAMTILRCLSLKPLQLWYSVHANHFSKHDIIRTLIKTNCVLIVLVFPALLCQIGPSPNFLC